MNLERIVENTYSQLLERLYADENLTDTQVDAVLHGVSDRIEEYVRSR